MKQTHVERVQLCVLFLRDGVDRYLRLRPLVVKAGYVIAAICHTGCGRNIYSNTQNN